MQIKTITCHDVYNHGASLQAYALQTYLTSIGHEVEIIDYKPDYLSGHYKLWTVSNPVFDKPVIKQLYLLAKLPERFIALRRKRKFDEFTRQKLRLTSHRYHCNEELKANPPQADVYIAGSDQIWNTLFQNGRDAAFYLDFAPKTAKRITYAASFATKDVVEEYKPFVRRMLQGLDCISLREKVSLPLLEYMGRNDGVSVCDPVFLLSRKQWDELIPTPKENHKPYLLVYDSDHSQRLKETALQIAKSRNLRIYNISAFRLSYADKDYWCSGPFDFVRLIRDAGFVISNSFHATAISLIFHREFCVVNRTEAINERMLSLLEQYGLQNRMLGSDQTIPTEMIDYNIVQSKIDEDIAASKAYLHDALS
jgi:hypothetical protein